MIKGRTLSLLALGFSILGSADAAAFDGKFKGVYVCAKLPTTRDILRAPIDMVIQNDTVLFARPPGVFSAIQRGLSMPAPSRLRAAL
jgi:hypothetical protein